jgi:hypothetical protein
MRIFFFSPLTIWNCYNVVQVYEEKDETRLVLTKPLALEGESDADYTAPNPLQLVLSLFKNVMPGSDLTRFQASHIPLNIILLKALMDYSCSMSP